MRKKNLLRRLLLVVIAVVLGLNIYRWNAKSLLGNELPMPFGYGMAIVLSGSMEPRLSVDDLVVIREADSVRPQEIIVYQDGDSLIIHRVIAVEGDTVLTQGDANNVPDEPITMDAVKGVLVLDFPGVGVVVRFLRRPLVMIPGLTAAVVLLELSWRKEKRREEKELDAIQQEIKKLLEDTTQAQ